jgi:hypothetical protein
MHLHPRSVTGRERHMSNLAQFIQSRTPLCPDDALLGDCPVGRLAIGMATDNCR